MFYWVKGFHRIRYEDPLFDEPFEEDIEDEPDLVEVGVANRTLAAVSVQIGKDVIITDLGDVFVHIGEKM